MFDTERKGKRIELIRTSDPHTMLKSGDKGTIRWERFDGIYNSIAVDWDNGSTLSMLEGLDQFRILPD